ncbi:MAG TPA: bifunctional phosphoglucose/phosphomannose isomerase [Edaphocola sp.]|nr:bifunctional phosphoglucose/phosphomannose isomerase [Edaphocola sp.]
MTGYQEMKFYVQNFPNYLGKGLEIGHNIKLKKSNYANPIKNIVLTGLGGSGIGAELVHNYLEDILHLPLSINKNYHLPKFVNNNTLVIVNSYSGDTEETLQAFHEAKEKKAMIVCITSGGTLKQLAENSDFDIAILPEGMPPRVCVPTSFSQILFILKELELIDNSFISEIEHAKILLEKESSNIQLEAQAIAKKIYKTTPILYSNQDIDSVITRWRQQLNENSKILAWERAFPEMNHNELVGWKDNHKDFSVLFLHTGVESQLIKNRFEICKEVIKEKAFLVLDIFAKGNSFFSRALYLIYLGDWLSVYLAELRGVDAVEVEVINYLKETLAKRAD